MSRSDFELKTPEQFIAMRKAGLITAKLWRQFEWLALQECHTLELDRIANETIESFGAHSNFQLVAGYNHTICASINHEVVHGIPAEARILEAGDILSVDCGAEIDGWNGDSAITIIVPNADGSVPETDKVKQRIELSRVTEGSLWAGIAALAKAERLNEVGAAIEDYIDANGKYGILGRLCWPRYWSKHARRASGLSLPDQGSRSKGHPGTCGCHRADGHSRI
jgi:methionyl aminopeptidase